jgi:hypothetical protein
MLGCYCGCDASTLVSLYEHLSFRSNALLAAIETVPSRSRSRSLAAISHAGGRRTRLLLACRYWREAPAGSYLRPCCRLSWRETPAGIRYVRSRSRLTPRSASGGPSNPAAHLPVRTWRDPPRFGAQTTEPRTHRSNRPPRIRSLVTREPASRARPAIHAR